MSANNEKIIELSKKKILLLVIGSFVFVALGIWLLSVDETFIQSQRRSNDPVLIRGVGVMSIIFFGFCGVFALKKLFDKKPGLVFNNSGIIDNASPVSVGLIPWSEIIGFEIFGLQRQKMLIIKVRDPQKYVEQGGALKRTLNKANYKMCGSPIAISSNALDINFSELLSVFDQYLQKYGNV
jgi:hypothetical protein